MENFDEIYRKNFQNQEDSLSANDDAQLWDSIIEELGPDDSKVIPKKNHFYKGLGLSLLLFTLIVGAFFIGREQGVNTGVELTDLGYNAENTVSNDNRSLDRSNDLTASKNNINPYQSKESIYADDDSESKMKASNGGDRKLIDEIRYAQSVSSTRKQTETSSSSSSSSSSFSSSSEFKESNSNSGVQVANSDNLSNLSQPARDINKSISSNSSEVTKVIDSEQSTTNQEIVDEFSNGNEIEEIEFSEQKQGSPYNTSSELTSNGNTIIDESKISFDKKVNSNLKEQLTNRVITSDSYIQRLALSSLTSRLPIIDPQVETQNKVNNEFLYSIGFFSGANRAGLLYSGTNADVVSRKNNSENAFYGYNAGADAELSYKNKWVLNVGLVYQMQQSIYEESFTRNIMLNRELTTGILVNSDSYQVIDEYNVDTTVNFNSYNEIRYTNSLSSLNIPILVGRKFTSHNLSYGLLTGVNVRFRTNQEGKIVSANGELISLTGNSNAISNPINIGLTITPFAEYYLSNVVKIRASYILSAHRPIISMDQSLQLINSLHSVSVGLRYDINK